MGNAVVLGGGEPLRLTADAPLVVSAAAGGPIATYTEGDRGIEIKITGPDGQRKALLPVEVGGAMSHVPVALRVARLTGARNVYVTGEVITPDHPPSRALLRGMAELSDRLARNGCRIGSLNDWRLNDLLIRLQGDQARAARPEITEIPQVDLATADLDALVDDLDLRLSDAPAGGAAFVTLCSPGYEWGTLGLIKSLRDFHDDPIVVICSPGTDQARLRHYGFAGLHLVEFPDIILHRPESVRARYHNTLSKFLIYALIRFDRVVYLDSDMMVFAPLDPLVQARGPDLLPLTYHNPPSLRMINVCTMSITPGRAAFAALRDTVVGMPDYTGGGDHGYLIRHYRSAPDWQALDDHYGMSQAALLLPDDGPPPAVIHYHGTKPWRHPSGAGLHMGASTAHRHWFLGLRSDMLADLIMEQRWDSMQVTLRRRSGPWDKAASPLENRETP